MADCNRCAKINVKVLFILILIAAALGTSLIAARHVRRRLRSEMELKAGQAAFDKGDWFNANRHLGAYISLNPDEVEILKKLAKSKMSIRPIGPFIGGAIATYRRVLQLDPGFEEAYDQLAVLYKAVGRFDELQYIAEKRLNLDPNDGEIHREAQMWQVDALIQLGRIDRVRSILGQIIAELEPQEGEPAEPEYVQACIKMSSIPVLESSPDAKTPLDWLTDAVNSDPESVEALARRARVRRYESNKPATDKSEKDRLLADAREDLKEADKVGTENAQILAFLCEEWMQHGELERAEDELKVVENLPQEVLDEHFLDIKEWTAQRFILASELARQKGDPAKAASLADTALKDFTDERYRTWILVPAIISYVADANAEAANSCLEEYLDATRGVSLTTDDTLRIAYLEAMVARVKGLPYEVIDILQPILVEGVSDFELWLLLADAYSTTGQPRRAIRALERYLLLQPNDSQARLQKVAEHLRLGDWAAVREDAQRAELLNPEGTGARLVAQLLRIEASAHIAVAKEQSGATGLQKLWDELAGLRDQHPDRVDIRILQAVVAGYLEQPEISPEDMLKQAIEEFEGQDKLRAEMQLVRHYRFKRDPNAISLCEAVCQRHPELAGPWQELSALYITNGDPNSARRALERGLSHVAANDAGRRGLSMRLALLDLTQGDRAAGRSRLEDLRAQDKGDIQVRSWLLRMREVLDDRPVADKLVEELKEAEGDSGFQWRFHQAVLLLESDDTDVLLSRQPTIEDDLQYCIDADPNWSAPVLLLGDMYSDLGDLQRAEDTYRRALTRDLAAPEVVNALMALFHRRGRLLDAEQLIDRLKDQFKITPQAASDWNLGLVALGSGNPGQAIEELKIRASNEPNDPNLPSMLARLVYGRYESYDQAKAYLDEAKTLDPNSNCVALITAEVAILIAEGKTERARQVLDEYVKNMAEREVFNAYVLRAAFFMEIGETESAEKDYREFRDVAGQGATGYLLLADFYAHSQDFDKAVKAYDEGLTAYSADLGLKRGLVKALYSRGSTEDKTRADGILEELEERLPNDPELMTIRARRLLEQSASLEDEAAKAARAEAEKKLRRAVRLEPTAIEAQLLLIRLVMEKGKDYYETARDISVRAIGSNPRSPELVWERVGIEVQLENPELAHQNRMLAGQLSEAALREDPNNSTAREILVAAALQSKENDLCQKAAARLEDYCSSEEGRGRVREAVQLTGLYYLSGNVVQAGPWAERALEIDPNNSPMRNILAEAAQLSGDNDLRQKAIARLEAYCSTEEGRNGFAEALTLAELYRLSGNMDQAKQWVERAEQMDQTSQAGLGDRIGLASALYKTGDADGAKKLYRELHKQDPNNVRILNDLAWILQEHDEDYSAAIELADAGIKIADNDVVLRHLLDTRGTTLSKMMNRSADARTDFERLLTLSPAPSQEAKTRLELGRLCEKLGEPAEARQHLERALTLDRQNEIFTDAERSEISRILQGSGI